MEASKHFNKEVARRTKKEDWVKSLEHHKDDFDLSAVWEALQEKKEVKPQIKAETAKKPE